MSERFWHVLFNISLPSHNGIIKYCGDWRETQLCALCYWSLARRSVSYFYVSVSDRGLLMAVKGRVSIIQVRSIFILFSFGDLSWREGTGHLSGGFIGSQTFHEASHICGPALGGCDSPSPPPPRLQHTAYRDELYTPWTPLCLLIIEPLSY